MAVLPSRVMSSSPASLSVTTVYLARHGESETNDQGMITGQLDVGLAPKGVEQSEALARCLAHTHLDAIYTSALRRTVATATPTALRKGMSIARVEGLNEIHMGMLQGRFRDDRDVEAQSMWEARRAALWAYEVPGGERFDRFAARVEAALAPLLERHRGQSILIVGHRATNQVLLGTLLGWERARWEELKLRNKYFYRIVCGESVCVDTFVLSGSKTGQCIAGLTL